MRPPAPPPPRPGHTRTGALSAFLFCVGSGVLSLWIAITGPEVSGGIPTLPYELNQLLGRAVFGVGGIICLAVSVLAFRDFRRPS